MPPGYGNPTQTIIDIITRADPTAIQQFQREIQATVQYMNALRDSLHASGATSAEIAAELQGLAGDLARFQGYINAANTSFGLTQSQASGAMQAVLGFSRGLEDIVLTGGNVAAALNNVPQLTAGVAQALGAGTTAVAAWTAGVSIAGSAALVLYQNWDVLMESMGNGRVKTEAEEMRELAKATERTAEETEKLLAYQERQANLKQQQTAQTDEERERRKQVNATFAGDDRKRVRTGLIESARDELIATDPEARDAADALRERREALGSYIGAFGRVRRTPEEHAAAIAADPEYQALGAKLNEKLIAAAEDLMNRAALDPGKLQGLIGAVGRNPAAFPAGLADKLQAATPEGQAEAKALEKELLDDSRRIGDAIHAILREAHEALADATLPAADREAAARAALGKLDASGFVGDDAKRAREQLRDMLGQAGKATAREQSQLIDAEAAGDEGRNAENAANWRKAGQERKAEIGRMIDEARDAPVAERGAKFDAAEAEIGRRSLVLSEDDVKALRHELGRARAGLARKQGAAGQAAAKKAEAAAKAEAAKLDDPFLARLEMEMAENARRIASGAAVASSPEEYQWHQAMGNPVALSPEMLRGWQQRRVGFDLAQAGKDPQLAGRIVANAEKDLQQRVVGLSSRTARTGDQVADNQLLLGRLVEDLAGQVIRAESKAEQATIAAMRAGHAVDQLRANGRRALQPRFR